jgi:nucleoside phosphorylase
MLARLIADEKPSLVISIGLGGGVRPGDQAGDVVATTRARFGLHGELESFDGNDQEYGAGPAITEDWFDGIELPEDREPALLPMSAHVACPGSGWPQPPPHRPSIRVDSRPVLTQPSTRADLFVPAPTAETRTDRFLGDTVAAVDMDAAIAAKACADAGVPFAAVIGISVPAIAPIPDDWEATLRDAWTEVLHQQFATAAARNAVTVTQRIVAHFHA